MRTEPIAARCTGVVRVYRTATGEVHALQGVSATIVRGALTAVVGPSGSGKSTLLRLLAGMDRPTAGTVEVAAQDLTGSSDRALHRLRRTAVRYVFQRPTDNLVPHLTARAHVAEAARRHDDDVDPMARLASVGLEHRAGHRPAELSGGEQQRLAVAQAMVGSPVMIIADEPTAELDHSSAAGVLRGLHALTQEGLAVVVATHDPQVVEQAEAVLELSHGAVASERLASGTFAVIDGAGRIQIPDDALGLFPDRRAILQIEDDGIRLLPPHGPAGPTEGTPQPGGQP